MNNRSDSKSVLIKNDDIPHNTNLIQYPRYTPISLRQTTEIIMEPVTDTALDDDFKLELEECRNNQHSKSVACSMCDCSNNCFCYPVCGCQTLYQTLHNVDEFTMCPLTSNTVDSSIMCAGINHQTNKQNMICNTISIPFTCVIDIVTLMPRAMVSIFASICNRS